MAALRHLPSVLKVQLAWAVGRILFALWGSRRRAAIYWSSRALRLPLDHPQTLKNARDTFVNFSRFVIDFVESSTLPRRRLLETKVRSRKGFEAVERIARDGAGGLFISGHVGNWELVGIALSYLRGELHVVALPLDVGSFNRFAQQTRSMNGFRIIHSDGAARRVLGLLRKGAWVAILGDRPISDKGEKIMFLGKEGAHPLGMVRLAKRAGVPVVFGAGWWDGDGRYDLEYVSLEGVRDPDVSADELLGRAADVLEDLVTRHPDQWYIAYTSGPGMDPPIA